MEKTIKTFKHFSEKGYKHYTENTIEELDELPLDNHYIITEFTHLCEWLRVNHGIWVYTKRGCEIINHEAFDKFQPVIEFIPQVKFDITNLSNFNSPQEAYSAAFDYILNNNLI